MTREIVIGRMSEMWTDAAGCLDDDLAEVGLKKLAEEWQPRGYYIGSGSGDHDLVVAYRVDDHGTVRTARLLAWRMR